MVVMGPRSLSDALWALEREESNSTD
jgi:hypothetical protein